MDSPPRLDDMPEVLTASECAAVLRISVAQVYDLVSQGDLPRVQGIGHVVRVPKSKLRAMLQGEA